MKFCSCINWKQQTKRSRLIKIIYILAKTRNVFLSRHNFSTSIVYIYIYISDKYKYKLVTNTCVCVHLICDGLHWNCDTILRWLFKTETFSSITSVPMWESHVFLCGNPRAFLQDSVLSNRKACVSSLWSHLKWESVQTEPKRSDLVAAPGAFLL